MLRFLKIAGAIAVACLLPVLVLRAQQPPPSARGERPAGKTAVKSEASKTSSNPIERIKEEGLKHSQVMATLSYLTDVIGPRLTGSPNLKRANEWTRDKLAAWGAANAHLEAWGPFGRGWMLKRFSAQVVEPQCIPLIGFPKAWSPGTDGTLTANVVYFDAKTEADFAAFKGKLKGAIVLTSPIRDVDARWEPLAKRKTDSELLTLANASEPNARGRGGRRGAQSKGQGQALADGRGGPGAAGAGAGDRGGANRPGANSGAAGAPARGRRFGMSPDERWARMEFERKRLLFLTEEGAVLLVDVSSRGDGGTLFVDSAGVPSATPIPRFGQGQGRRNSSWDKDARQTLPQLVMAQEHYNRLARMIEHGENVKVAVDLAVQFQDDDPMAYNTVAELPGSDLKDEIVMLGGHIDSWHSGTGATDNGAGVSVAMEAVRILQALDLKPRRTIRIALWSGEEQGLLGSRAFVKEHFGKSPPSNTFGQPAQAGNAAATTDSSPKPEFDKFSAYFNLDNGTGKIRGVYLQGNEAVRPVFRKWLEPFRELGAATLTSSNTGGTDHTSFDAIGLPGFQFIQDQIEYDTRTHHSNQDVFDRIQADDMKQASVIMAAFVYNAAMMDQKLPRKPASGAESTPRAPVRAAAIP